MLYLSVCLLVLQAPGQEGVGWKIMHNKQQLLLAHEEDVVKNRIQIRLIDLKQKGSFTITYAEMNTGPARSGWIRTMAVYDEADKELYRKNTNIIKWQDRELKKMLASNKIIKVFTWALPKDPAQAARVRVRRVHLCTIELI